MIIIVQKTPQVDTFCVCFKSKQTTDGFLVGCNREKEEAEDRKGSGVFFKSSLTMKSLSFNSEKFLTSLLISVLADFSFSGELFNSHKFVNICC